MTNHLVINASNQLQIVSFFFNTREYSYNGNVTSGYLESMEISKGYLALPLNVVNVKTATYNMVFILKNPTTYPFFDSKCTGVARLNLARLHYERIKAIHE
jgi:hypothetical protein